MRIKQEKRISRDKWVGTHPRITFHDPDHTPYNKRPGEVKSHTQTAFTRYGNGSVGLHVDEVTTSPGGRTAIRTISIDFNPEWKAALIAFLTETE